MYLMLAVIFLCVALGLAVRRVGGREQLTVAVIAAVMTSLYFFVRRLM